MNDIAVRVENLGKMYRIGRPQERYRTMRDSITQSVSAPFKRAAGLLRGEAYSAAGLDQSIWALRDASFEIKQGDIIGIIGRNGAGKSTLLKILSRITEPTEGLADVHGRIGALLEVGTGFHPELTGRENIFLNGAILGMSRDEIRRKFDEIVTFAEVEKFVDTPVKHFSSGMGLRLGFAVAVHLEPEILVVDEVLAVGDAQFQKKCLKKMQEVGGDGRTILFVSHNMSAVRKICTTGLILESGRMAELGEVNSIVDHYLSHYIISDEQVDSLETASFEVLETKITSPGEAVIHSFDQVQVKVTFQTKTDIVDPGLYVGFLTAEGYRLAGLDLKDFIDAGPIQEGETRTLGFNIPELPLMPGFYHLEIHLKDMASYKIEIVPKVFEFEIVETPVYAGRKLDRWFGVVGLKAEAFAV